MKYTPNNIIGMTLVGMIGLFYISQMLWGIGLMLPDPVPQVAAEDPATEALAWLEDIKTNQIAIQEAKDSNRQLVISIRKAGYEVDWSDLTLHRVNFDKIDPVSSEATSDGEYIIWKWQGAPEYKNERLAYYQKLLQDAGVDNPDHLKNFTSQLITENGALDPLAIGDNGISLGIPQINMWVHHGVMAQTWLDRNPEWRDWKLQMEIMRDWTMARYEESEGDVFYTVLRHNSPRAALAYQDNGYWAKVVKNGKLLTL
jgi:hypothetical protein